MDKQNAVVIADSITEHGDRLTTIIFPRFPKCLQAQLNTHRVFSRNSASSRAIPIKKMIAAILEDPFIPSFTAAQKGMQGAKATDEQIQNAREIWMASLEYAIKQAEWLNNAGIHKQDANRLLEPFMRVPIIVSGTDWENFFRLRCDHSTQPDFQAIAIAAQNTINQSCPNRLANGEWHIPFGDRMADDLRIEDRLKIATARCARISYKTHDGNIDPLRDFMLHDNLLEDMHLSPFEHCARVVGIAGEGRNFSGHWRQYRSFVEINAGVLPKKTLSKA